MIPQILFSILKGYQPSSKDKPFFEKSNETYVGKHENYTKSGIVHFNDTRPSISTTTTQIEITTQLETTTEFSVEIGKGTIITYKIFEVSNILIIVGALTIITLALIIMCCFCYGCKSRERRYTNRDMVRARVVSQGTSHKNNVNALRNANYSYDTPTGAILNHPNPMENIQRNYPHYEMVDLDFDEESSPQLGLANRNFIYQQHQPAILPVSQPRPAVSTGQRRLNVF